MKEKKLYIITLLLDAWAAERSDYTMVWEGRALFTHNGCPPTPLSIWTFRHPSDDTNTRRHNVFPWSVSMIIPRIIIFISLVFWMLFFFISNLVCSLRDMSDDFFLWLISMKLQVKIITLNRFSAIHLKLVSSLYFQCGIHRFLHFIWLVSRSCQNKNLDLNWMLIKQSGTMRLNIWHLNSYINMISFP